MTETTAIKKKDIRDLTLEQITEAMVSWGEKAFRAKQVFEWLWKKRARSFDEMTNLSQRLDKSSQKHLPFNTIKPDVVQKSNDGTVKIGFRLHDGNLVEGVLIPTAKRMTACVSSQVGCSLSCTFCATGYLKRQRNLKHYEVFDQVAIIDDIARKQFDIPLVQHCFYGHGRTST